ncbi:MAG TPA: hypothetical protein VI168_00625 [Croceibacterium sp.]
MDFGREAALSTDRQAHDGLLTLAEDCEAQASAPGLLADALFREAGVAPFRQGYVFRPDANPKAAGQGSADWGQWSCDLADHDRLRWSDKVYELFGLPVGAHVERAWAVGRYSVRSRSTLQRVREYALRHAFGFMLDAEIEPHGGRFRWIRMLAVPVFENGRITRLHGLKRAL